MFSYITALDVDSEGRIYVGDWYIPGLTVLSDTGELIEIIGRRGEGPGEFLNIQNVQVLPGDSVLVFDRGLSRISVFPPVAHRPTYTVQLSRPGTTFPMSIERIQGTGRYLASYSTAYRASDSGRDDAEHRRVVHILDRDGFLLEDAVLTIFDRKNLVRRAWGRLSTIDHPFGRETVLRLTNGRLYHGRTDDRWIYVHTVEGVAVDSLHLSGDRIAISQADIDAAAAELPEHFREILQENSPDYWPVFSNFVVDESGRVWVGRPAPGGRTIRWEIFDTDGHIVGVVPLPPGTDVLLVRGDRIYGIERDEFDVPRIVIFEWELRESVRRT